MYTVQEDSNLTTLETWIARGHGRRSYVDCVGRDHKVSCLAIEPDGAVGVTYRNKNGGSFGVTVHFARLSLDLEILKGNRYYNTHRGLVDSRQYEGGVLKWVTGSDHVVKPDLQLVGFAVGDLLRHFHHTHPHPAGSLDEDDEKENDKLVRLVKRALATDLSTVSPADPVGVYTPKTGTLYPWDGVRATPTRDRTTNLEGFFRQVVYLSESSLERVTKWDKESDRAHVDREALRQLLESLTDAPAVARLLRYHLYNEDPEIGHGGEIEQFDPPRSVPEILQYMHTKTKDDDYLRAYHEVMKTLNQRERETLDTKYKDTVFVAMRTLPPEYPAYALRTVWLRTWAGGWRMAGDLGNVFQHAWGYRRPLRINKLKHRIQRTGKTLPVALRNLCLCRMCTGKGTRAPRITAYDPDAEIAEEVELMSEPDHGYDRDLWSSF